MRKAFLIFFLCSTAWAGGPKYTYPSPKGMDDEMNNIYHDLKYPNIINGTASTMTVTNLTVNGQVVNPAVYTLSSSADVQGPTSQAALFVMRDTVNGGAALVLFGYANTPVIVALDGGSTVFVTGAPTASQIQVKVGTGINIAFRAGSSRNNVTVQVASFLAQ